MADSTTGQSGLDSSSSIANPFSPSTVLLGLTPKLSTQAMARGSSWGVKPKRTVEGEEGLSIEELL